MATTPELERKIVHEHNDPATTGITLGTTSVTSTAISTATTSSTAATSSTTASGTSTSIPVSEKAFSAKKPALILFHQKQTISRVKAILEQHKKRKLEFFHTKPASETPAKPASETSAYKLPPLVFFVAHTNPSVFQLLAEQLPALKSLGYSRICFEHDNDKTLDETIKEFCSSKEIFESEKRQYLTTEATEETRNIFAYLQIYQDSVLTPTLEFLMCVKREASWLQYVGIDGPLAKFRTPDFAQLLEFDKGIDDLREDCFALTTAIEAEHSAGGTIVIAGYGHSKFQEKLEHYQASTIKNYLFFEFMPMLEDRFLAEETLKIIKETVFKYKPIPLDTTKGLATLTKEFQEKLQAQLSNMKASVPVPAFNAH